MNRLFMIILLLIVWCGFSNSFTVINISFGLLISIICHFIVYRSATKNSYHINIFYLASIIIFVIYELIYSSILVAEAILLPKKAQNPTTIELVLLSPYHFENVIIANLLSLTPGTLSIDFNRDKSKLIIHLMFADQKDSLIKFMNRLQVKLQKVFIHANH